MKAQPMIAVDDVPAASAWYQRTLGLSSGHGGDEYEQLVSDGAVVLQLHAWHEIGHPELGRRADAPRGHGVVLWFHDAAIDAAYARARAAGAQLLQPLHVNPLARHREFALRDLDGYRIVVAGACGDVG
jgi:catechol 2,3-dioxygenase-like lactoylglutathione lyase family enzyme